MKPIYLAGPMTGIPAFNAPMFTEAAAWLRRIGYTVISPLERDPPETQAHAWRSPDGAVIDGQVCHETVGEIYGRDIRAVVDEASAVVLLPGWERSKGARIEAYTALLFGLPLFEYVRAAHPVERTERWVKERL